MKKTLIALAVLAASGASFAQVTITGNLTMGYQAKTIGANPGVTSSTDSAGFGTETSEIDFMATEDLGGGMKATAMMALAGADRSGETGNGTVNGRNASLALSSKVGSLTLATASAADYLSGGIAGVGAYYAGFNGKVLSNRVNRDSVTVAVPVGAFTLAAAYEEAASGLGLGLGTTGNATVTDQSRVSLSGTYSKGPIAANVTYLSYNARNNAMFKDETRASGSYDFGVAAVGLGAVVTNSGLNAGGKATDYLLGVTAPLGAVTLGAQFVSRKIDDIAFTSQGTGTITGTAIEADYALSKRTKVIANYARWTAVNGNDASTQAQVLLAHSF